MKTNLGASAPRQPHPAKPASLLVGLEDISPELLGGTVGIVRVRRVMASARRSPPRHGRPPWQQDPLVPRGRRRLPLQDRQGRCLAG